MRNLLITLYIVYFSKNLLLFWIHHHILLEKMGYCSRKMTPRLYGQRSTGKGGAIMLWDFLLFIAIGPLVAFFIYYLTEDRRRTKQYLEELREGSRLSS